jgi:hypothetical protein
MAHDLDMNAEENPFWERPKRHYTVIESWGRDGKGRAFKPDLPAGARLTSEGPAAEAGNYTTGMHSWWVVEVTGPRGANAVEEEFDEQEDGVEWFTRKSEAAEAANDRSYGVFLGLRGREV